MISTAGPRPPSAEPPGPQPARPSGPATVRPGPRRVDPADLARVAGRIRAAAAEADALARRPGPLWSAGAGPGSAEVARSLAVFVESWHDALADVVADANRLAAAVTLVASDYDDVERLVGGWFR